MASVDPLNRKRCLLTSPVPQESLTLLIDCLNSIFLSLPLHFRFVNPDSFRFVLEIPDLMTDRLIKGEDGAISSTLIRAKILSLSLANAHLMITMGADSA